MGTYSDSKIRTCRVAFTCGCGQPVNPHMKYLDFRLGLRNQKKVCMKCAMEPSTVRKDSLKHDCRAMREFLGMPDDITREG